MSLFVWFAFGVLMLASLAAFVAAGRVATARVWWGALLAALAALLLGLAALPWHGKVTAWQWRMEGGLTLRWQLDAWGWPLLVTALALALAVLLTDAAREARATLEGRGWAGVLLAGAVAVPTVLAATPLTLGALWAVADAAVLLADLARLSRARHRSAVVWVAFARAVTWLAAGVAAVLWPGQPRAALLLWLAALALRLLVAALEPAVVATDMPLWRPVWTTVHVLGVLTGALWAAGQAWTPPRALLVALTALAAWGALRWQRTTSPLRQVAASGLALGSLALVAAAQGQAAATWAWGALAVFPAWGVVMAPHRRRVLWPFFALLMVGLTLWPFTPASAAVTLWQGAWRGWMVLAWLALVGSLIAVARQGMALPAPENPLPREKQAFCLLGMVLWTAVFWGWLFWRTPQPAGSVEAWLAWASGGAALAAAAGLVVAFRRNYVRTSHAEALLTKWSARLVGRTFWGVYRWVGRFLRFFSLLLEGDGGVLWALVLLVMLAVLLQR